MSVDLIPGSEDAGAQFNPVDILKASEGVALYNLGADSELVCEFYEKKVAVPSKSSAEAIHFDTKVYCRIFRPAEKKFTIWDQPVREQDKQRFPKQWELFKAGKSQTIGTVVECMVDQGLITKMQLEMVKHAGIQTVEQLASATEAVISGFGTDGQTLQKYAKGLLNYTAQIEAKSEINDIKSELAAQKAAFKKELAELKKERSKLKGKKDA